MVQTIQAKDITLEDLQEAFQLQPSSNPNFFNEWQVNLPALTDLEKLTLDRVRNNYFNLVNRRPLLENAVKMVVLSPLLDLAGLYQAPFSIKTEPSVEITVEDGNAVIKGNIDVLVVYQRLWVLVIESKSIKLDVMTALPQALAYMLASPNLDQPNYGFLVNGREFVFVKMMRQETLEYNRSYALSIERDDDLNRVLSILKRISQLVINS